MKPGLKPIFLRAFGAPPCAAELGCASLVGWGFCAVPGGLGPLTEDVQDLLLTFGFR
jgi:hypothetical protein